MFLTQLHETSAFSGKNSTPWGLSAKWLLCHKLQYYFLGLSVSSADMIIQLPTLCVQLGQCRNWLRPAAMCSWAVVSLPKPRHSFSSSSIEVGRRSLFVATVMTLPSWTQSLQPEPSCETLDLFSSGRKSYSLTTSVFMNPVLLRYKFSVCSLKNLPLGAEGQSTPVLFCEDRVNWSRQVFLSQYSAEGGYQTLPGSLSTPYQESGTPFWSYNPSSEKIKVPWGLPASDFFPHLLM